ncbi:MAG: helix-turn-helix domain-containing protein, partial [Gemmatimonadales bacterium]
ATLVRHPVRRRILAEARKPVSAAELAVRLDQPRQRLNYHVRELARTGFQKPAGRRMKRNLEERRYLATARAYVLSPELLGPLAAHPGTAPDRFSATYLQGLTSLAQEELGRVQAAAEAARVRVRTLSLHAAVRFESAAQRAAFAAALTDAVSDIVAAHTSRARTPGGEPGPGQPFRLVVGCYPIPTTEREEP